MPANPKYVHITDPTTNVIANVEQRGDGLRGALEVSVQDPINPPFGMYAWMEEATPTLTSDIAVDDTVFNIDSNANIDDDDAITIFEGAIFYQSIVVSSTATTVTVATPCDAIYTTAASISIGTRNLGINGLVTPQTFKVYPPPNATFDVASLSVSALDDVEMDTSTFFSIANGVPPEQGLLIRITSDRIGVRNGAMFFDNMSFEEWGWRVTFLPENKNVQYGMIATSRLLQENAAIFRLSGPDNAEAHAIVRADLSSQTKIAIAIKGHLVAGT